jgi:ribosomal protein S12 methylthiotransferase accessory factor
MKKSLQRHKPYKALSPVKTIELISGIFQNMGISLTEHPVSSKGLFHACSLSIVDPQNKQVLFSSYGKGICSEYARASAYAEIAERFQNLAFYMMLKYSSEPETDGDTYKQFKYYPDEKLLPFKIVSDKVSMFFRGSSAGFLHKIINNGSAICIPFWNVFDRAIDYFPFRMMQVVVGSNGMCSGNTKEEAIIQGISEIFERHVLKQMYKHPFCPPEIPLSFFEGYEIHDKISSLINNYGWEVHIKDCSLGKNLPVVGVLVMKGANEYLFHLGADPSPVTALERCFTEMHQGGRPFFKSLKELFENLPYNRFTPFWKSSINMSIASYQGHWPDRLLSNDADYEFKEFRHPVSISDAEDLQYLLQLIQENNMNLFIRDNSYLGFPSYYIYIPGMSEISTMSDDSFAIEHMAFDQNIRSLTNLPEATADQKELLAGAIRRYIKVSPGNDFRTGDYFKYFNDHPLARLSHKHLLSLLESGSFNHFLPDNFSVYDINQNNHFPSKTTGFQAESKFAGIIQNLRIPACFKCKECDINPDCSFGFITSICLKMKTIMNNSVITQQHIV